VFLADRLPDLLEEPVIINGTTGLVREEAPEVSDPVRDAETK
jgi:hypothetical protein